MKICVFAFLLLKNGIHGIRFIRKSSQICSQLVIRGLSTGPQNCSKESDGKMVNVHHVLLRYVPMIVFPVGGKLK